MSIENQGIHLQRVKADRRLNIGFRENIKWSAKKKSYTKHRVFTAKCTPKGVCYLSLTKS